MAQQGRSPEVDAELKKLQGVQNGQYACVCSVCLFVADPTLDD